MKIAKNLNEVRGNNLPKINLLSIYNITKKELEIILQKKRNDILDIDFDLEKSKIL